nr:hypothetical protein [uncultured Cohaesibacter sp.]
MFSEIFEATRHLILCLPAASRVANDVECGRQPSQADLQKLDIDDVFNL